MIYLELFWTFFKIGAFTFGGGYAMLPLIQEEVLNKGWMNAESIMNFIAVSESTPGPFAINIATYVGAEKAGILGSVCTTFGVVLPSFIVILIVAQFFNKFKNSGLVKGCMSGLRPAVIGMIASAVVSMGKTALFPSGISLEYLTSFTFICLAVIFIASMVLAFKKVHPIVIILMSASLGIAAGYAQKLL